MLNRIIGIIQSNLNRGAKSSLIFLKVVITISFAPVVLLVGTWCYIFYIQDNSEWSFKMMDYLIKIIDHIWTAQLVAGVMAYGAALVDNDSDGVPDTWERK